MAQNDLTQVAGTYPTSADAAFARSLLQSAGIESYLRNDVPGGRYTYVELWVAHGDAAEAREILRGLPSMGGLARDDKDGALRIGLVAGMVGGGFAGALMGWLWPGAIAGAVIGVVVGPLWHRHSLAARAGDPGEPPGTSPGNRP